MLVGGFTSLSSVDAERGQLLDSCPYSVLLFVSAVGDTSRVRLSNLLNRLGVDDRTLAREAGRALADELLQQGHLFEVRDGIVRAFPAYAVQREDWMWEVFGDARVDRFLSENKLIDFDFESKMRGSEITIQRLVLAEPEDGRSLLEGAGVRTFSGGDLAESVPAVSNLAEPLPWPSFTPSTFARWENYSGSGEWIGIPSTAEAVGLCRGIAEDPDGGVLAVRYFFKHLEGWSPITEEEGLLWMFKLAADGGSPFVARFDSAARRLEVPFRVPFSAYMALKFLSASLERRDGVLLATGVDTNAVRAVFVRLRIDLRG